MTKLEADNNNIILEPTEKETEVTTDKTEAALSAKTRKAVLTVDTDDVTLGLRETIVAGTSNYVQNVKVCRGINAKTITPTRRQAYEQNYYSTGRTETAI